LVLVLSLLEVGHCCKKTNSQTCINPQGENGGKVTKGCLQRICKGGVWEKSLANNICCFERTAYTINTTISSSREGCVWAAINCVEETPGIAKTIFSLENLCKKKDVDRHTKMKEGEGDVLYRQHDQIYQLPSFTPLDDCTVPEFHKTWSRSEVLWSVTTIIDGLLTSCGGEHDSSSYFDTCSTLLNGSWVEGVTPHMIKKRSVAGHSWTNKGLFVTGGFNKEEKTLSHTEYLTRSGKWEEGPRLPYNLRGHCQVTVGSDVYVLGGRNNSSRYGLKEVWKLSEGACDWSYVNSMLEIRNNNLCAVHDNYIYTFGGEMQASGERMNLISMTWEKLAHLPPESWTSGQIFSFQSSLYLVNRYKGLVVRLTSDNKWEIISTLEFFYDTSVFPAPLVTRDILGC